MKQILILIISIMLIIANLRMIGSPSSFNSHAFSVFDTLYLDAPQDVVDKISAIQLQDSIVLAPKLASNECRVSERDSDKLNVDLLETILHKVHDYKTEIAEPTQLAKRFEDGPEDIIQSKPMQELDAPVKKKNVVFELDETSQSRPRKRDDFFEEESIEDDEEEVQPYIGSLYQSPNPYQQTVQQPYQQFYQPQQNPMAQTAALAMQLQASAMAMQAQASALMMQAQQQGGCFAFQPFVDAKPALQGINAKKRKTNQLLSLIKKVLHIREAEKLLSILDLEFELIENLLANNSGQVIERIVQERNNLLKKANPVIYDTYELILDLATMSDGADQRLYNYFVRKNRKSRNGPSLGKKQFLRKVMISIEHYYEMIEKMEDALLF